jgi:hypothetical protein
MAVPVKSESFHVAAVRSFIRTAPTRPALPVPARGTLSAVARSLVQKVHNPRGRTCACDPDCWCRRTALGRLVKWWFPGRWFGLHHKNRALEDWKRSQETTA